jgi:polar amino acid transport system substrate-binding protein
MKVYLMKPTINLLFSTAIAFVSASIAQSGTLDEVKAQGELKFGLEAQYRPFEFRDENNDIIGYDIDLGNAFAESLGVVAVPVDTNWGTVLGSLYSGEFDMILGGMTATEKRFEQVNFSVPYMDAATGLLVMKGGVIMDFEDLVGQSVGAGSGTPQIEMLTGCAIEKGIAFDGNIQTFDNDAFAYEALATGRIVGYSSTIVALLEAAKVDSDLMAIPWNCDGKFGGEWTSAAFTKENDSLRLAFDEFITEMKTSGKLEELQLKWFGQSFVAALPDTAPSW